MSFIDKFWDWLHWEEEPSTHTYIVLQRIDAPTPSETVTAWQAYEAAPQVAGSPEEAIDMFVEDLNQDGEFIAVLHDTWLTHLRPRT